MRERESERERERDSTVHCTLQRFRTAVQCCRVCCEGMLAVTLSLSLFLSRQNVAGETDRDREEEERGTRGIEGELTCTLYVYLQCTST